MNFVCCVLCVYLYVSIGENDLLIVLISNVNMVSVVIYFAEIPNFVQWHFKVFDHRVMV